MDETCEVYCKHCNKKTKPIQATPDGMLHLILSILTYRVWLIVWHILREVGFINKYKCPSCGSKLLLQTVSEKIL